MTVNFLPPRGTNSSGKVDALIRLWDKPLSSKEKEQLARLAPITQQRSVFGNINNGTPYPSTSCMIGKEHPHFKDVIEDGVQELVHCVGTHHNLVTYTSCGGHQYPDERPNNRRHVGVVLRDQAEYERVKNLFMTAGEHINAKHTGSAIEIAIMDHTLNSSGDIYLALDLYLQPREGTNWDEYFAQVDMMCKELVDFLYTQPPCSYLS